MLSIKAYNNHHIVTGKKIGLFKQVIFYGSSSDGSVGHIGDILKSVYALDKI